MHYDSIARMPYRSRNAVYSPTPPLHDAHNDSGYSTRMYGSSKGASPSLSGKDIFNHRVILTYYISCYTFLYFIFLLHFL